jgi:superfamily II DNA/RNA helicase
MSFLKIENTGLQEWLSQECIKKKIHFLTNLQQACIPAILSGKDILAFSRTGTGKTLTYVLPLLNYSYMKRRFFLNIIITPTLETSLQVSEVFNALGAKKNIASRILSKEAIKEKKDFKRSRTCLISSINNIDIFLYKVFKDTKAVINCFVIDEADSVFENFILSKISLIFKKAIPRQCLIFGVSLTNFFYSLIHGVYEKNLFIFNELASKYSFIENFIFEYIFCPEDLKNAYLKYIILDFNEKNKNYSSQNVTIVFTRSEKQCIEIFEFLKSNRIKSVKIHKNLDLNQRICATQIFKKKRINVLICTDIGSRGIDISSVNLIINLNMPKNIKTFLHRIGRGARLYKKGKCLNLICQDEIKYLNSIENYTGIHFRKSTINLKK